MAKNKTTKEAIVAHNTRTLTADELVAEIAKVLKTWDGEFLKDAANDILTERVSYDGDSLFTLTPYRKA